MMTSTSLDPSEIQQLGLVLFIAWACIFKHNMKPSLKGIGTYQSFMASLAKVWLINKTSIDKVSFIMKSRLTVKIDADSLCSIFHLIDQVSKPSGHVKKTDNADTASKTYLDVVAAMLRYQDLFSKSVHV